MKISVIIATYNRSDMLAIALESLVQLTVSPDFEWEVLIVDNNSKDSTKAVANSFVTKQPRRFRYIFEPQQGKSFALNTGVREARGELIAFTDDDVTVHPDWLMQLVDTMSRFDCAGVGGRIVPVWTVPRPDWLETEGPNKLMSAVVSFNLGSEPCAITTAALGANCAFRKEMFLKHGTFRADLGLIAGNRIGGEDTEFCRRLIKSGERLYYAPTAIIYHPVEKCRTEKSYFESWYLSRGRASIKENGIPRNAVRYFGVPRFMLRILSEKTMKWLFCLNSNRRFHYRLEICEIWGQILESRASSEVCK
jgi:glucosyl-dolichyl phosphate glucuronosyltransferase